MTAYSPEAWETFFLGNAGAAAALAGLVFVGVSINVDQIVTSRRLTGHALEALALLGSVLVYSVLVLVPGITKTGLGIALAVVGLLVWGIVTNVERRSVPVFGGERDAEAPRGSTPVAFTLAQLATVPVLIGAVTLLAEGGGGLYWLVVSVVFAYVTALVNAWVLLIEIRR